MRVDAKIPQAQAMGCSDKQAIYFSMVYPLGVRLQSKPRRLARTSALPSSAVFFPFYRSEIKLTLKPLHAEIWACM